MSEEKKESVFSKFKKKAGQAAEVLRKPPPPVSNELSAVPPPPPPPPPPLPRPAAAPQSVPAPSDDRRVAGLEAALQALRGELEAIKSRPVMQLPPAPAEGEDFAFRLGRAEGMLADLRKQLPEWVSAVQEKAAKAVSKDEIRNMELRVSDLAESMEGLHHSSSHPAQTLARLEVAEAAVAELKTVLEGQRQKLEGRLDVMAPRDDVDALRVNISSALSSSDELRQRMARYADEFSDVRDECRRALGEMQGLTKAAAQVPQPGHFEEYLKDTVAKLSAKLAEVETSVHAGMSELSGKLNSNEVLYKKIFTDAEERLAKSVEPQLKSIDGQLRWLRESVLRLSDDYSVVTERKIRALEAKYSAFEAISRRMDAIDAALKKSGRIGLP
jgi:hypothetical protein